MIGVAHVLDGLASSLNLHCRDKVEHLPKDRYTRRQKFLYTRQALLAKQTFNQSVQSQTKEDASDAPLLLFVCSCC